MTTAAYFQVPHALFESWSEASKTFESAAEEPDPATAATAFGKAAQLCEMAAARREAADKLQELQGAIRVLVRCRPLSPGEVSAGDLGAISTPSRAALSLSVSSDDGKGPLCHDFGFDSVLGADCNGRQVGRYQQLA